MITTQDELTKNYNQTYESILATIDDLRDALESHKQGTNSQPDWGHIGDLVKIKVDLQEIVDFAECE